MAGRAKPGSPIPLLQIRFSFASPPLARRKAPRVSRGWVPRNVLGQRRTLYTSSEFSNRQVRREYDEANSHAQILASAEKRRFLSLLGCRAVTSVGAGAGRTALEVANQLVWGSSCARTLDSDWPRRCVG